MVRKYSVSKKDFQQCGIIAILTSILLAPNIFTAFSSMDLHDNFIMQISYMLLAFFVWLSLIMFFRVKTFFWVSSIFLLIAPIEIIFVKNTGSPISGGFVESIFNTNTNETFEQINSNYVFLSFWIIICLAYIYLVQKLNNTSLKKTLKFAVWITFLLFNVVLFFKMTKVANAIHTAESKQQMALELTLQKYEKIYPINLVTSTISAVKSYQKIKEMSNTVKSFSFGAHQKKADKSQEIYVLVIGETARYQNFHINGYNRETTPLLDQIDNLFIFSDVYSTANFTSLSVPQLITRANPENLDVQFKEKSVLEAFKEAGFYTAWIGNQSEENLLISRIAKNADYSYFTKGNNKGSAFYDINLTNQLSTVLKNKSPKKFIVIHSLGSHFNYSNRYPNTFEKYTPAISQSGYDNLIVNNKKEIINSYDNSILYTDYFLSNVIKILNQQNASSAMLYVSDHGENLYDDNKRLFHGTETPSEFEYHVPFFIWSSINYLNNNTVQHQSFLINKNKKASSTTTFYTLLDIANINYKNSEQEVTKSIANPNYTEPKKRTLITGAKKIITLK